MPSAPRERALDPRTLRVLWTVLVVVGTLGVLYLLRTVLLVLAFAVVFAYLIFPLVKLAERGLPKSGRRPIAIGVVYIVLVAGVSTVIALVGPPLGRELTALGQKVPDITEQIKAGRVLSSIFPRWSGAEVLDDLVRAHLPQVVDYAQHALRGVVSWLSGAWVVIMVPIFAFFFLRDAERIADTVAGTIGEVGGSSRLSATILRDLHSERDPVVPEVGDGKSEPGGADHSRVQVGDR